MKLLICVLIIILCLIFIKRNKISEHKTQPIFIIEEEPIYYFDRPFNRYYKPTLMNRFERSRLEHTRKRTFA
jgi:hypothetical protein